MLDPRIENEIVHANQFVVNDLTDMESGEPVCNTCAVENCAARNRREHVIECGDHKPIFGSPIQNCAGEEVVSDAMIPPSMFPTRDGPQLAREASEAYNMLPGQYMRQAVFNAASPALATWAAQANGTGGPGTNPAGQYGPPPRVVHSVSELLGNEPEGEELGEEEEGDIVSQYFNPDTHKIDVQRGAQDSSLSPRVKRLTRRAADLDRTDAMGSGRSW